MFKLIVVGHPVFNTTVEHSSEVDSSAKALATRYNSKVKVYQVAKYLGEKVAKEHFINTVQPKKSSEAWSKVW